MSKKFDTIALTSSSAYFAILTVYLIFILTNSIKSKKDKDIFNGLRIATLILPIIYFAKLGYIGLKIKNSNTVQKTLLSIYFLLVLIVLCLDIQEGDKKQYIYALIFVSPLLIISSFFLSYEQWKADAPKYVVLLSFFLAFLYYTSFYDFLIKADASSTKYSASISDDKNTLVNVSNESIVIIQTILSFILFFLFGYMAYKSL